jgi:hypothetical protein
MFPGGKGGRCVGLTTLPPLCADWLEIWEPQPPGTLRACPGLQWDYFALTFLIRPTQFFPFPVIDTDPFKERNDRLKIFAVLGCYE